MEPGKQQENNCKNRKIPELNISAQYPENGRMYRLRGCAAGFRVFRPATGAGLAGPFAGNLMVAWLSCQSTSFTSMGSLVAVTLAKEDLFPKQ